MGEAWGNNPARKRYPKELKDRAVPIVGRL